MPIPTISAPLRGAGLGDADPATMPLVRVVEDDPAIQALFQNMSALGGFAVAAHGTAAELLATLDPERIGCLVIDLCLPDMTGIELLQALGSRGCELPVVFTSGMARIAEAVKAIKLGSVDFLEKPFDIQEMQAAIQRAIELDRQRRSQGANDATLRQRFARLSPREAEVMELVVRGAANKEVAHQLGLSPKTVEVHRANVMRKTEASSLAELVRLHVAVRG